MNRRRFVAGSCAACAAILPLLARAQASDAKSGWRTPERFTRPDMASEEGGLWAMMDREEARLRKSPFVIRDKALQARVHDMCCRLGGPHCPDIRVYLMRTPFFNANMAPNGMMQVWSGLMLRAENEAQLAAVVGHEIGHYLERHSLERLRSAKSHSATATAMSLFGIVGLIGMLGVAGSMSAYSRDHERDADRIGLGLMHDAGYDAAEAAKVWRNLLLEIKARPEGASIPNPLFNSHPSSEERQETLAELAKATPGGATREKEWNEAIKPFLREWLADEVKRGQREESLALLGRMIALRPNAEYLYARGETYRLRGGDGDLDLAIADYKAAVAAGSEPPEAHRSLGTIYWTRKQAPDARASYQRYLELQPNAPDAAMVKSYLEEIGT